MVCAVVCLHPPVDGEVAERSKALVSGTSWFIRRKLLVRKGVSSNLTLVRSFGPFGRHNSMHERLRHAVTVGCALSKALLEQAGAGLPQGAQTEWGRAGRGRWSVVTIMQAMQAWWQWEPFLWGVRGRGGGVQAM